MTTNGATLRLLADQLRGGRAGAASTSASTRSTAPAFAAMTRRDELHRVLDGIAAAKEAGFDPVKLNTVVQRGVNDDELVDLATFGRERGVEVRFIEFMPLDAVRRLERRLGRRPGRDRRAHRTPCTRWSRCRRGARRRPTGGATSTAAAPSA